MPNIQALFRYWRRQFYVRIIVPVKYSSENDAYFARGSSIGLFIALTPTVGVQIPILFFLWAVIRKLVPKWDFSIIIASVWTLITNVITVPFFYYLFLQTGRILLGRWDRLRTFDAFKEKTIEVTTGQQGWLESVVNITQNLFGNFGLPLIIGSLPWAIASALFGYYVTIRFVKSLRSKAGKTNP